jgi:hypothetical protein
LVVAALYQSCYLYEPSPPFLPLFFSFLFSVALRLDGFRSTPVSFYYCPTALGFTHQKKVPRV